MSFRLALVALACLAVPAAAQRGRDVPEAFEIPRLAPPTETPPPGCAAARERAAALRPDVESDVPAPMQAALRAIAADHEPDETEADGWHQAAALAALDRDVGAALWAELMALQGEWRPEFATAAGVYLHLVGRSEDAMLFLNCAYADGFRSPWLLEALANVHRCAGRGEEAKRFAREAVVAAPADPILSATASLIETGHPPPPPPPETDDAMDRALAELQRHMEVVLAAARQHHQLQDRVNEVGEGYDESAARREEEAQLRQGWMQMLDAIRPTIAQAKQAPKDLQPIYRNVVFHTLITMYLSVTHHFFVITDELWNPWSGSSTLDISFWGEVLGLQPVEFTRKLRALKDFEYEGFHANVIGGWLDDFGAAPWDAFSQALADWRYKASGRCTQGGSPEQQRLCVLEVDRQFCAAQRQLLRDYVDTSEQWFQKGARGFDRIAARRLATAAIEVEDAFRYASTWAREMKFPPGDAEGAQMMRSLQERYAELVDDATGQRESGDGPGHMVRHQSEIYAAQKENSEIHHAQLAASIQEQCEPVDLRVLEQLAREQADAMRSMLLDRLLHDFDVEWDPNASCTFSVGKYFRASVDINGKVNLGGSWKWLETVLPTMAGDVNLDVGRRYKFDFKDGEFVGASAGLENSAKYGPFTGKGSATFGVAWDEKKGDWTYPVELGGSLGFGLKTKRKGAGGKEEDAFGVECIPGKARVRFDARVVAKDAMAWVAAVRGK